VSGRTGCGPYGRSPTGRSHLTRAGPHTTEDLRHSSPSEWARHERQSLPVAADVDALADRGRQIEHLRGSAVGRHQEGLSLRRRGAGSSAPRSRGGRQASRRRCRGCPPPPGRSHASRRPATADTCSAAAESPATPGTRRPRRRRRGTASAGNAADGTSLGWARVQTCRGRRRSCHDSCLVRVWCV